MSNICFFFFLLLTPSVGIKEPNFYNHILTTLNIHTHKLDVRLGTPQGVSPSRDYGLAHHTPHIA
jgi:hypothetical protein